MAIVALPNFGARHPERQIEHLEGATPVLDLGQCAAVGDLRIGQRLGAVR